MTTAKRVFGRWVGLALGAMVLAGLLGARGTAAAEDTPSLDALRKSGTVGERFDGFAVLRVASSDAGIRKEVDAVNAKRAAIYEASARKQNVPALEVGKVYAMEILARSPPGTWFLGENGAWKQKQ